MNRNSYAHRIPSKSSGYSLPFMIGIDKYITCRNYTLLVYINSYSVWYKYWNVVRGVYIVSFFSFVTRKYICISHWYKIAEKLMKLTQKSLFCYRLCIDNMLWHPSHTFCVSSPKVSCTLCIFWTFHSINDILIFEGHLTVVVFFCSLYTINNCVS